MDSYELAKKWLKENERRLYCAQLDCDGIAIEAFCAGFKASQQNIGADKKCFCDFNIFTGERYSIRECCGKK